MHRVYNFLFYISKALYVNVILYFVHSFSFSPRGRFIFQTEISRKYIVLVWISLLFYFFSYLCRGDQSTVSCIVSFDFNWSRSPKIRHPFALVFVVVLPILEDMCFVITCWIMAGPDYGPIPEPVLSSITSRLKRCTVFLRFTKRVMQVIE